MSDLAGGPFRVKSLDAILADATRGTHHLRRALGPLQLTLLGLGAIIGAGIFATIGTAAAGDAARPGAGPALVVSFVITAIACAFTALCYAELAAMVPVSGSAYTYAYATLGELAAWVIGWDLIIEYAVGNVAVAISWANYFRTLLSGFGLHIPDWLGMDYRTAARVLSPDGRSVLDAAPHLGSIPIVFNLPAVLIVAAISLLLVWGIRESAKFNAVMVTLKVIVLGFFCVVGLSYFRIEHFTPFAPNGWHGISAGAAIVFFAFIGFDAVSTVAEETRDPQRDLPKGIIASLIVSTLIYAAVAAVFSGLISYPDLKSTLATEQAEPLTLALSHASPDLGWAVAIVAFGSVCAHTAVLLVFQLGQPRIFYAMSRDGLLPPLFAAVHARFRTPHWATILSGIFVAIFAAFASIDEMVDLTNIGTLFAFVIVCVGVMVLRVKDPDRPRPFKVPFGFLLPSLGVVSCLYLIYYLPPTSWLRFAGWLNLGFAIYAGYGSLASRLTGRDAGRDAHRDAGRDAHRDAGRDAVTGAPEGPVALARRTARHGVRLAWVGVAMLAVTHMFDVYLRHHAVADVFTASSWLSPGGFFIVPLAVNGLVLAPMMFVRARRAGGEPATVALAALLALGAVAYLATVVLR